MLSFLFFILGIIFLWMSPRMARRDLTIFHSLILFSGRRHPTCRISRTWAACAARDRPAVSPFSHFVTQHISHAEFKSVLCDNFSLGRVQAYVCMAGSLWFACMNTITFSPCSRTFLRTWLLSLVTVSSQLRVHTNDSRLRNMLRGSRLVQCRKAGGWRGPRFSSR
jgi:hypothetical protein